MRRIADAAETPLAVPEQFQLLVVVRFDRAAVGGR